MGSGGCHYHLMRGSGKLAYALCQSGDHDSVNDILNPCCPSMASRSCCPKTHSYMRVRLEHNNEVWFEFWNMFPTKMAKLQDLRATIGFMSQYYGVIDLKVVFGIDKGSVRSVDAPWLERILKIRGLGRFELEIFSAGNWQETGTAHASSEEYQPELKHKTEMLLEDMRRIVCKPSPS